MVCLGGYWAIHLVTNGLLNSPGISILLRIIFRSWTAGFKRKVFMTQSCSYWSFQAANSVVALLDGSSVLGRLLDIVTNVSIFLTPASEHLRTSPGV